MVTTYLEDLYPYGQRDGVCDGVMHSIGEPTLSPEHRDEIELKRSAPMCYFIEMN